MIFENVKVGDQFKDKATGRILTITGVGPSRVQYTCEPYMVHGDKGMLIVTGGTLFISQFPECWDFLYEKVLPDPHNCPTCKGTGDTNLNRHERTWDICPDCDGFGVKE